MLRRRNVKGRAGHRDEEELIPLVSNDDRSSTGSYEKLRLIVLGGDGALMDEACGTILGERQNRNVFKFGRLEPRNADACERQVSVLKTPVTWLRQLKSFLFFSRGVKAIRTEMESNMSKMFPGPHAFLLVHRDVKNSGREYYLLKALSDVYGKEVLDYCMVLFMDRARHNDPRKNKCLKMCGSRYHILHNTEESLNELFEKIETMNESKNSSFFTNHLECYRKAKDYFQEEYKEEEKKLREELNDSKERGNQLTNKLKDSEDRERQLKDDNEKLQRKVEQLNEKREQEVQVKEKEMEDRQRTLYEREKDLDKKEREVRSREQHQTTAGPAVSGDKSRPLDEREEELKSRDDSQASGLLNSGLLGIQKPVRRNSMEQPPHMSETM